MRPDFLQALDENWHPVAKPALVAWLAFYGLFLAYALSRKGEGLFIDIVFLPIHEGGHALFGWFGHTIGIAGGTLLQLLVPLAIAVYFVLQRQLPGTVFAAFFFFENFLNVGTYMADARRQELRLVTIGDPENVEHDWTFLFGKVGLLQHDTALGGFVRFLGWAGMVGMVLWFAWRARSSPRPPAGVITWPQPPRRA